MVNPESDAPHAADSSARTTWEADPAGIFFSDRFNVSPQIMEDYGAFDISVVSDLPVFIDPFLLFNSDHPDHRALHDQILEYLRFLRAQASESLESGLIKEWYTFGEVKQNWLGFTVGGNSGRGLGPAFAKALNSALTDILSGFGNETTTASSHLEKLALIRPGVGRDAISDFTTNLIKHYLLKFTEDFAKVHLRPEDVRKVAVPRAAFSYATETWVTRTYALPWTERDFVMLTPTMLLTKDETWINRNDLIGSFDFLPDISDDDQLRAKVNLYLGQHVAKNPTPKELAQAQARTLLQFPELIDCYIRLKEDRGDEAAAASRERVNETQRVLRDQVQIAARDVGTKTNLFATPWTSFEEALTATQTFKHYVENQDGWRVINRGGGRPFANEAEVQGFFGLLLQPSRFDVNREPNNGRGPVDFKISMGLDNTLIEFKLAKSSSLERNLRAQIDVYEAANRTKKSVAVIICYTSADLQKIEKVKNKLGLDQKGSRPLIVIDASEETKASASKV